MIITEELLLFSNGCMSQEDIAAAAAAGVIIGETTVSDGFEKLRAAGHIKLAAWLRVAGNRWALHTQKVIGTMYLVFNPLTGIHERCETVEQATNVRNRIREDFLKSNDGIFSVIKEVTTEDGSVITEVITLT